MTEKNKNVADLWNRYQQAKDIESRNLLIEKYIAIVDYHARKMAVKLPDTVLYDDIYSDGIMGLINAVERFDPTNGATFKSFASHRIRGAIRDGLRDRDCVPRWVRSNNTKFARQIESIQQKLGCRPHESEIRKRMNISWAEMERRIKSFGRIKPTISISTPMSQLGSDDAFPISDTLEAANQKPPVTSRREFSESQWLRGLSREDKLILVLYYCEGLNQREIGEVIGISESGVSQKYNALLERFRRRGLGANNG